VEKTTGAAPEAQPTQEQKSVVPQKRTNGVLMLLTKYKEQIERVIPKQYLTPERMLALVVNALNKTPELLNCSPITVVNAVVHIAQLGLEIRPGESYLVAFGKECVPIIDYRGKIKVARRGGFVRDVIADVVYSNDKFEFSVSEKEGRKLLHVPLYARATGTTPDSPMLPVPKEARGEPVMAYVIAWLKDEERPHIEVMAKYQIEEVRAMSKQPHGLMWDKAWDEGAKKTVIHRAMKMLAHDDATMKAQQIDDAVDAGISLENIIDITPEDAREAEQASAGGQTAVATHAKTADLRQRLGTRKRGAQPPESAQPESTLEERNVGDATGEGPTRPVSAPSDMGAQGEEGSPSEAAGQPPVRPSSPNQIREVKQLPDPLTVKDEFLRCAGRTWQRNKDNTAWNRVPETDKAEQGERSDGGLQRPTMRDLTDAFDFGGRGGKP